MSVELMGSQEVVYPPATRNCCYHLPGFSWITLVLIEIVMMKSVVKAGSLTAVFPDVKHDQQL